MTPFPACSLASAARYSSARGLGLGDLASEMRGVLGLAACRRGAGSCTPSYFAAGAFLTGLSLALRWPQSIFRWRAKSGVMRPGFKGLSTHGSDFGAQVVPYKMG